MTGQQTGNDCTRRCQFLAAGLAALIFVIGLISGWGFWASLVIGIVILLAGVILFPRMFCPQAAPGNQSFAPATPPPSTAAPKPAAASPAAEAPAPAPKSTPEPEPAPAAEPAPEPVAEAPAAASDAGTPAEEGGLIKPSVSLPGQEELAARKGS